MILAYRDVVTSINNINLFISQLSNLWFKQGLAAYSVLTFTWTSVNFLSIWHIK